MSNRYLLTGIFFSGWLMLSPAALANDESETGYLTALSQFLAKTSEQLRRLEPRRQDDSHLAFGGQYRPGSFSSSLNQTREDRSLFVGVSSQGLTIQKRF